LNEKNGYSDEKILYNPIDEKYYALMKPPKDVTK
jgi:hypothetical protein